MSKIVMRDADGGGQSRDGSAIQHHHRSSFGFENFEVNGQQRKKPRRGQLQKNEENEEKPEVSKTFMCMQEGCVRTFSSRFKLDRHALIHSEDRPFQCSTCGKGFHRKDHLKNHLQVHNPNKVQHTCELCQKRYSSVMSYRKHIALHAAEQGDLVCKLCGKAMADREGIMHHLKVHTGSRTLRGPSERKYPCDLCERCFFTKKDVKRHLVVHTGDRDFVCQYCPQRFGRKDHLVRHTKKGHSNLSSPPSGNNHNGDHLPRKYEVPTPLPTPSSSENNNNHHHHKNGNGMVSGSSPDLPPGLVIAPTPVMEHPPVLEPVKPDPTYGIPHSNIVHPNYGINLLPGENGQNLSRFGEPSLLPVSQYLPMSSSYPGVAPIMPHHHYINMSTASSTLPDHLPLMSMAPTFTPSLALEVNNPPLPHFNQAFQ